MVTGGSGICRVIAERFARDAACVVISGRRAELLQEVQEAFQGAGGCALAVVGDTAPEAGVEHLFQVATSTFLPVDILVNNAAVAGAIGLIWDLELAGWEETLRINLTGPRLCSRATARIMNPRWQGGTSPSGLLAGSAPSHADALHHHKDGAGWP